jgi:hypothetical protein
MDRLWLITNPHSGSAASEKCDAIEALCTERCLSWVGRTRFPDEPLPDPDDLLDADTVILFAGERHDQCGGAPIGRLEGAILILPGGTMNMLAKRLHGGADPHAIIHAGHERPTTISMPFVEAGDHRAFVGLIAGPVTAWAEAREAFRAGRSLARVPVKAAHAWSASWEGEVALHDGEQLLGRYQSIFVEPRAGGVSATGIAAAGMADLARLGWAWAIGDWRRMSTNASRWPRSSRATEGSAGSSTASPSSLPAPSRFARA